MKWILLILATLIPMVVFGDDVSQTTTRYRYNSIIKIDPTVKIMAEDGSWTNTAKTLGYLSLVTSDIQTQLNSKTNSVISGAALNLTNRANEFYGDQFTGTNFVGKLTGVASQATHATNADLATLATTAVTATNVQGFSLTTNNLVAVALVEQTNALGYVTNTYLTYTTNAIHYLGQ
jgi:hypothetical protein